MSSTTLTTKGMPFLESINGSLLALYAKGMVGWGEKYEPFLMKARDSTGLTVEQIKVFPVFVALPAVYNALLCVTRAGFVGETGSGDTKLLKMTLRKL